MPNITIQDAINLVPGKVPGAAKICGLTPRAIYKWIDAGRLPRTEYSGETSYAKQLSDASGGAFTADQLLQSVKPAA